MGVYCDDGFTAEYQRFEAFLHFLTVLTMMACHFVAVDCTSTHTSLVFGC